MPSSSVISSSSSSLISSLSNLRWDSCIFLTSARFTFICFCNCSLRSWSLEPAKKKQKTNIHEWLDQYLTNFYAWVYIVVSSEAKIEILQFSTCLSGCPIISNLHVIVSSQRKQWCIWTCRVRENQCILQGCALRAPGCLRWPTFAFRWPDNLISFV